VGLLVPAVSTELIALVAVPLALTLAAEVSLMPALASVSFSSQTSTREERTVTRHVSL
jgi:hypothetical protein